jgi:hypothetical protein
MCVNEEMNEIKLVSCLRKKHKQLGAREAIAQEIRNERKNQQKKYSRLQERNSMSSGITAGVHRWVEAKSVAVLGLLS